MVSRIQRDLEGNAPESLNSFAHLFEVAAYVGRVSRSVQESHHAALAPSGISGEATFILGGQIRNESPGLYLIYPQGNFIRSSEDTPYLQIGENKYGKPMLDRLISPDWTLDQATRLCVISLIATIKSNVSVGAPIDLGIYRANSFEPLTTGRLDSTNRYFRNLTESWDAALRDAFFALPDFQWPKVAHAPIELPKSHDD